MGKIDIFILACLQGNYHKEMRFYTKCANNRTWYVISKHLVLRGDMKSDLNLEVGEGHLLGGREEYRYSRERE